MASFGRALSAIAGTVGLVLLGVTAPAPAQADPPLPGDPLPPPASPAWVPARCAGGAIDDYTVESVGRATHLRMSGWIQPCAEGSPTGFVLIRYYADHGGRTNPVAYESLDSPTAFDLVASIGGPGSEGLVTAVCVAFADNGRVACLKHDPAGPGLLPAVAPVPTDDPLVRVRVRPVPIATTDPTCGTCV